MDPVKVTAILDSVATRKDKSLRVVFETNEVGQDQFSALFQMRDSFGQLIFAPSDQEVEIPEIPPTDFKNEKTPSQRLRAVLFVEFKQKGEPGKDFEFYYRRRMDHFVEEVKSCLDSVS